MKHHCPDYYSIVFENIYLDLTIAAQKKKTKKTKYQITQAKKNKKKKILQQHHRAVERIVNQSNHVQIIPNVEILDRVNLNLLRVSI